MSQILNRMETISANGYISDPSLIEKTINDFLDLKCSALSPCTPSYCETDISKGFVLNVEALRECSIRDMLTIIGYEPSNTYFHDMINQPWFTERKIGADFCCAPSCLFFTTSLLSNEKNYEKYLFLHIQYVAFRNYIKSVMKSNNTDNPKIWRTLDSFLKEKSGDGKIDGFTIGDLLVFARKGAVAPWCCTSAPLSTFVDSIVNAYRVIKMLFMDCIRKNLISSNRQQFLALLVRCCDEIFDSDYETLVFDNCYEM